MDRPDWLGAARRAAEAVRRPARRNGRPRSRRRRATIGEGGDDTLVIDARGRGRPSSPSSTRCTRRARASPPSARSAARSTTASPDTLVVIDPIDGSTNAKRGLPHVLPVDRGRRRADDGRRRLRRSSTTSGRRRSGRRRAAAARASTASGSTRRSAGAPQRGRPARAARRRVGRPAPDREGGGGRSRRPPTACARSGTIAVTLCQVAAARLDGDGHAAPLPRGRRGRRAADRARGRRRRSPSPRTTTRSARRWTSPPHSPLVAGRAPAAAWTAAPRAGSSMRPARLRAGSAGPSLSPRERSSGSLAVRRGPVDDRRQDHRRSLAGGDRLAPRRPRRAGRGARTPRPPAARLRGRGRRASPSAAPSSSAAYTGLAAAGELPAPETVDRGGWTQINLALDARGARPGRRAPGRGARPAVRSAAVAHGRGAGGRGRCALRLPRRARARPVRVPGARPAAPARLLFVGPEPRRRRALARRRRRSPRALGRAARDDARAPVRRRSVAAAHMADRVSGARRGRSTSRSTSAQLLRLPAADDLRALADAVRDGGLVTLVAGPERRALLDELQATMALLEGYAEHVMDAVGATLLPDLPRFAGRSGAPAARADRAAAPRRAPARPRPQAAPVRAGQGVLRRGRRRRRHRGAQPRVGVAPAACRRSPSSTIPTRWLTRTGEQPFALVTVRDPRFTNTCSWAILPRTELELISLLHEGAETTHHGRHQDHHPKARREDRRQAPPRAQDGRHASHHHAPRRTNGSTTTPAAKAARRKTAAASGSRTRPPTRTQTAAETQRQRRQGDRQRGPRLRRARRAHRRRHRARHARHRPGARRGPRQALRLRRAPRRRRSRATSRRSSVAAPPPATASSARSARPARASSARCARAAVPSSAPSRPTARRVEREVTSLRKDVSRARRRHRPGQVAGLSLPLPPPGAEETARTGKDPLASYLASGCSTLSSLNRRVGRAGPSVLKGSGRSCRTARPRPWRRARRARPRAGGRGRWSAARRSRP